MNLEEMDARDGGFQRESGSPIPKRIALTVVIAFIVYTGGYFLLFKSIGQSNTWVEFYFKDSEFQYCEELTLTELTWDFPETLSTFLYTIYYPAMDMDGSRIEPVEEDLQRVRYLYKKYIEHQAQAGVMYFVTCDEESISAIEHGILSEGETLFEEFDELDMPEEAVLTSP